jgi:hypothetical protein
MDNVMTTFSNNTPFIITAGRRTRKVLLCGPMLRRLALWATAYAALVPPISDT